MPEPLNTFFYDLDPETILDAVEQCEVRATGKMMALNSFENRVYQVEIELPEDEQHSPFDRYRVAKFYRPGRWNEDQIREEHELLMLLQESGVPVVAPLPFPDGDTLHEISGQSIWFCISQKVGGRHRAELPDTELRQIGRLLGQVHNVAQQVSAHTRLSLTGEMYGVSNMDYICDSTFLPKESRTTYRSLVEPIVHIATERLKTTPPIRIHGDCHLGNVLWKDEQPCILDFDDMVYGPAVQDIWLMNPGRDADSLKRQDTLLEGYEELRSFNYAELSLIELLRALRILHFETWIAKRWDDPIFPKTFEHFGTPQYWREELGALQEISELIASGA